MPAIVPANNRGRAKRSNARHHLKAKTNDLHEQLHALPAFVSLIDNTLDMAGYISIMRRFRDFYAQLDARVQGACNRYASRTQHYHYEPRAPMFAADVSALSGTRCEEVREVAQVPEIDDIARLAGVAYVVDGSVLGGMTMNRSARILLGRDTLAGRQYWNWCREHGAQQWQSALRLVEDCWRVEQARPVITDAALETFEALHAWLSADHCNTGTIAP